MFVVILWSPALIFQGSVFADVKEILNVTFAENGRFAKKFDSTKL
jgi:hypothetical protein